MVLLNWPPRANLGAHGPTKQRIMQGADSFPEKFLEEPFPDAALPGDPAPKLSRRATLALEPQGGGSECIRRADFAPAPRGFPASFAVPDELASLGPSLPAGVNTIFVPARLCFSCCSFFWHSQG